MTDRKPFVGGNWKMNTTLATASELVRGVAEGLSDRASVDTVVFPPTPYLIAVGAILRDRRSLVELGAQDVWPKPDGAFTGEVSTTMLTDCGVSAVLAGHSERRHVIGEGDELINAKVRAILAAGMTCVLCIGETLDQREAAQTDQINETQLRAGLAGVREEATDRLVIAYEPVWAIGTGMTATPQDAQNAHAKARSVLADLFGPGHASRIRVIYGGSVKRGNAADLFAMPDIDGGLIGGASLNISDFVAITQAAHDQSRAANC